MNTIPLVSPSRAGELIDALDSYNALDEVQRDLIKRWAEGADVHDITRFGPKRTFVATIKVSRDAQLPDGSDLGSLAIAIEELTDTWFRDGTHVDIEEKA